MGFEEKYQQAKCMRGIFFFLRFLKKKDSSMPLLLMGWYEFSRGKAVSYRNNFKKKIS